MLPKIQASTKTKTGMITQMKTMKTLTCLPNGRWMVSGSTASRRSRIRRDSRRPALRARSLSSAVPVMARDGRGLAGGTA